MSRRSLHPYVKPFIFCMSAKRGYPSSLFGNTLYKRAVSLYGCHRCQSNRAQLSHSESRVLENIPILCLFIVLYSCGASISKKKIKYKLILGAFSKLQIATVNFIISVQLSVCPHRTTRLTLDGFSWNVQWRFPENRAVYDIMSTNLVEPERTQTTWHPYVAY
jgi:hypothetical protein